MRDDRVTLRSYRLAFELERRLHRVDRFRIPLPYGIPLAGLGYGIAAGLLVVIVSGLPLTGAVLGLLPWPIRLIMLPALAAHLLRRSGSDGRPAHEALVARALFVLRPRRRVAFTRSTCLGRAQLADVVIVPDGTGPVYRRGRVRGPAHVLLRQPARATARRRTLELQALEDRPMFRAREVRLDRGERLVLR